MVDDTPDLLAETLAAWPKALPAADAMLFKGEHDPRTRATGHFVYVLDATPDWERFVAVWDRASRILPPLHKRVVMPSVPGHLPEWQDDPDFDLRFHLRRLRVPAPGTLREVLDYAEVDGMTPHDPGRPLWQVTLMEGLEDDRAAVLLKLHHAWMDGNASIQLALLAYDSERDGDLAKAMPDHRLGTPSRPRGLVERLAEGSSTMARRGTSLMGDAGRLVRRVALDPIGIYADATALAASTLRLITPVSAPPSPILRSRSPGSQFEVLDVPFHDLRAAAKAVECTINDAYLAGVAGGLGRYHEALGAEVEAIPIGMPISTRDADDRALGNQVAAAMMAAPIGIKDPIERMQQLHELVLAARYEPAMDALSGMANILVHVPDRLLAGPLMQLVKIDLGVSQVRGLLEPSYLAGCQIMRAYGFGPKTGLAGFIGMMTHLDTCCVGIHADPAAVTDPELLVQCLRDSFDEVIAVASSKGVGLRGRWRLHREALATRQAVIDQIHSDADFQLGLGALATQVGRDLTQVATDAHHYLDEMVTVHSEAVPDFNLVLSRLADRRSYEGVIQCDDQAIERLRELNRTSSLVMLTGHRSYTDFVVRVPFARRGFDREYRFAGANIAFWPMGAIGHTAGIVYIRRGFRDPVYSFVLRRYVGWLTEHRANFLWAIEGGRTRTGKLLAPKAGLLAYVADAYLDGRGPDVMLVPGTVVYEHLSEVFEYARYGRGGSKTGESLVAFLPFLRQQRRVPEQAVIGVGIGEPVALGAFLDRGGHDAAEVPERIQAALLEVSRRIDTSTPITAVALVLLPLLERDGVTYTVETLVDDLAPITEHIARRRLPTTEPGVGDAAGVRRVVDLLCLQGLITVEGSGDRALCRVVPGRHAEAAYYRNAIVHHFAARSIAEIAVVQAGPANDADRVATFWHEVDGLRDLLAHEFFFADGSVFTDVVRDELDAALPTWEAVLASPTGHERLLDALRPYVAPRALAPFLEAHGLVADGLRRRGGLAVIDERHLTADCLAHGRLELARGRIGRPDAVSLNMFQNPLAAARVKGLLEADQADGRRRFAGAVASSLSAVAELEAWPTVDAVSSSA